MQNVASLSITNGCQWKLQLHCIALKKCWHITVPLVKKNRALTTSIISPFREVGKTTRGSVRSQIKGDIDEYFSESSSESEEEEESQDRRQVCYFFFNSCILVIWQASLVKNFKSWTFSIWLATSWIFNIYGRPNPEFSNLKFSICGRPQF